MGRPYFRYIVKFNDEVLDGVVLGTSIQEKLEEPLDEGGLNIPMSIRGHEYEMYGVFEIIVIDANNDTKEFVLLSISDRVTPSSRYGYWEHEMFFIEYTEKLNKYYIDTFVNTLPILDFNRSAKFIINQELYKIGTSNTLSYRVAMPYLDIKENYYSGETTFQSVGSVYVLEYAVENEVIITNYSDRVEKDVFIQVDNGTKYNLSTGNVTLDLTVGEHVINYGVYDVLSYYTPIFRQDIVAYTFYINVHEKVTFTLFDVIERMKNIKPFETENYHGVTRLFEIGSNLETLLKSVEAPQFFIQKLTMFQALSGIFKYINSIPRLLSKGFSEIDELSYDDFNLIVGEYNSKIGMIDYSSTQDVQMYGTKAISPLERTIPNNLNKPNIETPANNFFKTVRATQVQLTYNKGAFALPLEEEIYKITKMEVKIPTTFTVTYKLGTQLIIGGTITNVYTVNYEDIVVDLTPRIINKLEWELKDNNVNFPDIETKLAFDENIGERNEKIDNIYFTQNSNQIIFSDFFGDIISGDLISNVVQEAFYEELSYKLNENYPIGFQSGGTYSHVQILELSGDFNNFFNADVYKKLLFNVEYITLQDFNVSHNREDTSIIDKYSEVITRQSDKLLNIENASRKSYGDLQRSSLPNHEYSKIHYYLDDVLPIGSIDSNGYVITKRSWKFFNYHLEVNYYVTKEHNRLQEFIGINQQYRPFEIPRTNQVYNRLETYNDIVFIRESGTYIPTTQNLLSEKFLRKALSSFDEMSDYNKITYALVKTDNNQYYGYVSGSDTHNTKFILKPVNVVGVKQDLIFGVYFKDNQVAGNQLEEIVNTDLETLTYNKPLRYTDSNARLIDLRMALYSDIEEIGFDETYNDPKDYPLITLIGTTSEINAVYDNSIIQMGLENIDTLNPFKVYKDSGETLGINYIVSFMSYVYGQFIVGKFFTNKNPLVDNNNVDLYLYVYTNQTTYGIFNDIRVKDYDTVTPILLTPNITISYSSSYATCLISPSVLSGATNWAIGDIDGNLWLACNENINEFDFVTTHFDDRITEIGTVTDTEKFISTLTIYETFVFEVETPMEMSFSDTLVLSSLESESQFIYPIENLGLSNLSISENFSYEMETPIEVLYNDSLIISSVESESVLFYEWVSGGTSPSGGTTCSIESDVGNVRCDTECVYVEDVTYLSMTDDTNYPQCTIGYEATTCVQNGQFWTCTVYIGTQAYTNCETCTEVS